MAVHNKQHFHATGWKSGLVLVKPWIQHCQTSPNIDGSKNS